MPELRMHLVACDTGTQDQIRRRFERDGVSVDATQRHADVPGTFTGRVPDVLLVDADADSDAVVTCLSDVKSEYPGVTVVIDPASAPHLGGASLDYRDGLQDAGFSISNPNASRTCGCGQSFS